MIVDLNSAEYTFIRSEIKKGMTSLITGIINSSLNVRSYGMQVEPKCSNFNENLFETIPELHFAITRMIKTLLNEIVAENSKEFSSKIQRIIDDCRDKFFGKKTKNSCHPDDYMGQLRKLYFGYDAGEFIYKTITSLAKERAKQDFEKIIEHKA